MRGASHFCPEMHVTGTLGTSYYTQLTVISICFHVVKSLQGQPEIDPTNE